jgi:hypothetical protein
MRPETAIRLCLVIRGDLEGERLSVPERLPPLSPRQGLPRTVNSTVIDVARFAARVIGRCLVDGGHFTVRKSGGVEVAVFKCILVEQRQTNVL